MGDPGPRRAGSTVRDDLRRVLASERMTAHQLSAAVGVPERDVVGHLEHLDRSLRREGKRLGIEAARCDDCGFTFEDRKKLGRPSRCPKCRSERVRPPWFYVIGSG